MTTSPVVTITDELLAEIEAAAKIADPISTELYGDRYMRGHDYSRTDLSEPQDKYIRLLSAETVLSMAAELRTLRAQNAELARDAGRYQLFAETVVAEFNDKQLTPPQMALFAAMNAREQVSDVADLAAMFDAAMQASQ